MQHQAYALLFATLALQAHAAVQLLPAGEFKGRDGRPGKELTWKLSDTQGQALANKLNLRHQSVDFQFDYEHQTVLAAENGQPSPASGWGTQFEWRAGDGLYVLNTQWTARAKAMIEAGEYKYLSPYITYHRTTGEVLDVLNAGLVAMPNLDISPVASERLAQLNAASFNQEKLPMDKLLALLGLAATATEDEAIAAVNTMKSAHAAHAGALNTALGLAPQDDAAEAVVAIAALKAQAAGGDASTTTAMLALQSQVATLTAANNQRELQVLVDQALVQGKLIPAQKEWAMNKGLAFVQDYLKDASPIAAGLALQQSAGKEKDMDAGGKKPLTPEQKALCSEMGYTEDEFRAGINAAA
jgi:phage I-like protein